jgi:hypothetical protein
MGRKGRTFSGELFKEDVILLATLMTADAGLSSAELPQSPAYRALCSKNSEVEIIVASFDLTEQYPRDI